MSSTTQIEEPVQTVTESKTESKHPVYDFLTDDVVQTLRDLKNRKLKGHVVIINGRGGNGKSTFIEIIRKVLKTVWIPAGKISGGASKNNFVKSVLESDSDAAIIQEFCEDEFNNADLISQLNGLCLILVTNVLPTAVLAEQKGIFGLNKKTKVIEFKNEYVTHLSGKDSGSSKKIMLHPDQIVNDEAIKIVSDLLV